VSGWWARKLWNENTVETRADIGFTKSILDLQVGKASKSEVSNTFVNTRGINFRFKQINFSTTVFESQGRFAGYNRYAESIKPAGGNPATSLELQKILNFHMISLAEANLTLPQVIHRFTVGLR
jgi:hypothetical protein